MLCFAVGAEHVEDLVLVELLHLVAGRAEIFAGIELSGLLVEHLAHGCGHGKTAVGVDVDLAYVHLGCLAELLLGDADSVRKLAAILVDDVDILLGNGR